MEDEEGYMVLDQQSKRGAAGRSSALQGAAPGCPRWHRVALGAGWTGNVLLGVAVVALGCSFLLRQPQRSGKYGNWNAEDINGTLESFISELRKALCLSQPQAAQGCRICPQGWTLGSTKCYWISTKYSHWNKSREQCRDQGSTLLVLQDQDELEVLGESLQQSGRNFWIGLWLPETGMGWMWVNGSSLDRNRFQVDLEQRPGECGMVRGSTIIPENCSLESRWICQREATKL